MPTRGFDRTGPRELDDEASRYVFEGAIRRGRAVENARVVRTWDGEAITIRDSIAPLYLDTALG